MGVEMKVAGIGAAAAVIGLGYAIVENPIPRYAAATTFGTIGIGETRLFAHTLPAGRNLLQAAGERGAVVRAALTVANHGTATCKRRYLWRIE